MRSSTFGEYLRKLLPAPFTIALLLTLVAMVLPMVLVPTSTGFLQVLGYWHQGFWELLGFSMQMVLILVLGHTLALTPLLQRFLQRLSALATTPAKAAALTGLIALLTGFINWGLCIVVGAILARKVAENAHLKGIAINYPLVAAAGYSGMMVWHGGLSGSAPLVVAGQEHFLYSLVGTIPVSLTLFSTLNISLSCTLLLVLPAGLYLIGKKAPATEALLPAVADTSSVPLATTTPAEGMEHLDRSPFTGTLAGVLVVGYSLYLAVTSNAGLTFLDLNYINFLFFGLCLLLHGSIDRFLVAVQDAVGGASGIIVQFPLYAGIMGIMKYSGLIVLLANAFITHASPQLLPFLTFLSAGLINVFVPSGGGQWAVQGPVIVQAALGLGVPVQHVIMALAYGDGLTNMLQPFWALPLLGITGLQARDILPYTLLLLLMGLVVYSLFLLLAL